MTTRALLAVGLLVASGVLAADKAPAPVARIELPQARVNGVDVSKYPQVRVFATLLDRAGKPLPLKAVKKLAVLDKSKAPLVAFQNGAPLDKRKDAKLQTLDKAGVGTALGLVVVGHQDDALRQGSLGRRVKEGAVSAFKSLGKTDRVNVFWYGDRIYKYVGLKGMTGQLSDVEDGRVRKACRTARDEALAGGAITGAGSPDKKLAPGTDLCGLTADHKPVSDLLKGDNTAFQGYFPRLFNLGERFYRYSRYCTPPKEALDKFGEFTPANLRRTSDEREELLRKGEPIDWETSAFEEALRAVIQDGAPDERKTLVLLSDGRDGYLRDEAACIEHPPKQCEGQTKKALAECLSKFLLDRHIAEQADFKAKARYWIGLARAAHVQIYAVGLGMLGHDYELERLRLLAERTGGTFRVAEREEQISTQLVATMQEALGQVTIDFTVQQPVAEATSLDLKLQVELDPGQIRGDVTRLDTAFVASVLPPTLTLKQQIDTTLRSWAASMKPIR